MTRSGERQGGGRVLGPGPARIARAGSGDEERRDRPAEARGGGIARGARYFKKCGGVLRARIAVKYAFIEA